MRRIGLVTALLVAVLVPASVARASNGTAEVAGHVTDAASGRPIPNICVSVTGSAWGSASTGPDGGYAIGGLSAGSYDVEFSDCRATTYVTTWYPGSYTQPSSPQVTVGDGQTVYADQSLHVGAAISGTVLDSATGAPVANIAVSARSQASGVGTTSAADGSYTLKPLPPGSYTIQYFDPGGTTDYLHGWYPDGSYPGTPVTVGLSQQLSGVDIHAVQGASVSGDVLFPAGYQATPGLEVWLRSNGYDAAGMGPANGFWQMHSVPAGVYTVMVRDTYPTPTYYDAWYGGATDEAHAATITLRPGDRLSGIDITLQPRPPGSTVTVSGISPDAGPNTGGQPVRIAGTNLDTTTSVYFGNAPASITDAAADHVDVVTPPGSPGNVPVTVITNAGRATTTYTYLQPPIITSVSPTTGGNDGGDPVRITGEHLDQVTALTFDGVSVTPTNITATEIDAVTPRHANGRAIIDARGPAGSANAAFTFGDRPSVATVTPTAVPSATGAPVIITGDHLDGTTTVTIGGNPATGIRVLDPQHLSAIAPPGSPGIADVIVTARGIRSRINSAARLTYL